MNTIVSFLMEAALTLVISVLIVRYLRPFLRKVLTDLCGTEDRAQFWTAFSNILLIGLPMILALHYQPEAGNTEALFFEVAGKLGGNLGGFLFALIGIGFIVSFFALVAPRPPKVESK
jgi:ABC-type cobalt transport system substrate-binding protein